MNSSIQQLNALFAQQGSRQEALFGKLEGSADTKGFADILSQVPQQHSGEQLPLAELENLELTAKLEQAVKQEALALAIPAEDLAQMDGQQLSETLAEKLGLGAQEREILDRLLQEGATLGESGDLKNGDSALTALVDDAENPLSAEQWLALQEQAQAAMANGSNNAAASELRSSESPVLAQALSTAMNQAGESASRSGAASDTTISSAMDSLASRQGSPLTAPDAQQTMADSRQQSSGRQQENPLTMLLQSGTDEMPQAMTKAGTPAEFGRSLGEALESRAQLNIDNLNQPLNQQADARVTTTQAGAMPSTQSAAATSASLSTPLNSAQWNQDFGQQMARMVQQGNQRISLQLNPRELGPLTVDLKVVEQQAQLQVASQHAQVRSAVEQAIPQLREALAEQGIQLGETAVGEQRGEQAGNELAGRGQTGSGLGSDGSDLSVDADISDMTTDPASTLNGGVNLYV